MTKMNAVRIFIEQSEHSLPVSLIRYVFKTLCVSAGLPFLFTNTPETECDICYSSAPGSHCSVFIKQMNVKDEVGPLKTVFENKIPFLIFPDQPETNIVQVSESRTMIMNDIIFTAFFLLSGKQERNIPRNRYDIHLVEDSFLYRQKLLLTPVVDKYAMLLAENMKVDRIPRWPHGKRYAVALSHDVDYPEILSAVEAARYFKKYPADIRSIVRILRGKETFWQFENLVKLEKSYNFKSAFYFCGHSGTLPGYFLVAPDPFYDIGREKFRKIMRWIDDEGMEIGMHASFFSYRSAEKMKEEKERVEEAVGKELAGNRHHYWHMNPDNPAETAGIHQQVGLQYDSSLSFEQHAGFRYGICYPFHLFDVSCSSERTILHIPPTLMDNHLFGYLAKSGFQSWKDYIDACLTAVIEHGGVFTADFHQRVMNETCYPDWKAAYVYLLERIAGSGSYWCDTPAAIARYCRQREEHILKNSSYENSYNH